jgi:hypothetical protein
MTTKFEIIDRSLGRVYFLMDDGVWIQCYLHENTLWEKRFTVVEQPCRAECVLSHFDTLEEAQPVYDAAVARTKALILEALK